MCIQFKINTLLFLHTQRDQIEHKVRLMKLKKNPTDVFVFFFIFCQVLGIFFDLLLNVKRHFAVSADY